MYNQKLSARHTFRAGVIGQQLAYDMDFKYHNKTENQWKTILDGDGSTQFYQAYLQLKSRLTDKLTLVGGLHGSYLALNQKYSIEPRAALSYQANDKNKFTLAAGLAPAINKRKFLPLFFNAGSNDSTRNSTASLFGPYPRLPTNTRS